MDLLASFLGRNGYLPHGYCFAWSPELLWSMVGADGVIAASYFTIPLAIASFSRKRSAGPMSSVAWLFCAFIFACGVTHVMHIWTLWQPVYGLEAAAKVITAALSVVTAVALWRLIPAALRIPSVSHLQSVIGDLESEIKKRRTAEEHLVDVQQSLAVTLATIGAAFITTDRAGRVTRMNAVSEQLLGWTQDEARGRPLFEVFNREDRPAAHAAMNPIDLMIESRITADTAHDVVAIARSGVRTPVEVKAALTHAEDGNVRGLAMVFRDISQRVRAEAESSRLAAIVESSNDAIIGKTLDGTITNWNHAAQGMFGYSAQEAIGQPIGMLIPADRDAEETRVQLKLAQGEVVPVFETERLAKDGSLVAVSVTISPIRDSQGLVVGVSKIARDVSHLRRAEAALRDSQDRLRFALESAEIGDWDFDLATGKVQRSLRHERCFGHEQLLPEWTFDTFINHVHPQDRAEVQRAFEAALSSLEPWHFECRVVWPDQTVHWISTHGTIQREGTGGAHMLGIVSDVTRRRLADESRLQTLQLESDNRQIQEANRLKSQFLANMSHELRTPLNAIIGFADLLHGGAVKADSPKYMLFLGHIGTSGRHLLQLINDVLDLSKVESGKFEFFPEPVDLPALLKSVGDVMHSQLQSKHMQLSIEIDPALDRLELDPARLKQVLFNYLSNAIKFTPVGGHVTLRALAEGDEHFRLEVEDDGIGVAEADLPRLFVEFQQLDAGSTKHHQGTGLGLSLTRRLVQAQGGTVGVRSTVGRGSVFHLVLRRTPIVPEPAERGMPRPPVAEACRLLVIEDERIDRPRAALALKDAGFQVDAAATGAQALQHASRAAYDAITLDLVLPDQTGLAVLERIRGEGENHGAPVVGMTMPATDGGAASFFITDVLCKPIRIAEVVAAMARLRWPAPRSTKILVIDDDPLALDLMKATLAGIDIDTVCELDGRVALRDLGLHRPDGIVLDLMMPGFDGFDVLDALRQLPDWRHTPVYIWTSMQLTDAEYDSLAHSASAILSKGGGSFMAVLADLQQWRPARARQTDRAPT